MDEPTPRTTDQKPGSTTLDVRTGGSATVVPAQSGTAELTWGGVRG